MKSIRELRESADPPMTQMDLAYTLKVSLGTVSLWERRKVEPRATQLRAMARIFGVSMDDIAFEVEDKQERPKSAGWNDPPGARKPLSSESPALRLA